MLAIVHDGQLQVRHRDYIPSERCWLLHTRG